MGEATATNEVDPVVVPLREALARHDADLTLLSWQRLPPKHSKPFYEWADQIIALLAERGLTEARVAELEGALRRFQDLRHYTSDYGIMLEAANAEADLVHPLQQPEQTA